MADSKISDLLAVVTPLTTDELATNQGGVSKKITVAQIVSLAAGGGVAASGTPVDNQLAVWVDASTIEGTTGLTYTGSILQVTGSIQGANTSAPLWLNAAGTPTAPNFSPSRADPNTGFSAPGADTLNIICGSQTAMILQESAGVVSVTVGQSTAATHVFTGDWAASTAAGPVLLDVSASSSVPTLIPNQADPDTGIGRDTVDGLAMIAGGLDCLRVREIAAARAIGFYTTTPIVQQTGVAVTAGGIHAALVALGLFTA